MKFTNNGFLFGFNIYSCSPDSLISELDWMSDLVCTRSGDNGNFFSFSVYMERFSFFIFDYGICCFALFCLFSPPDEKVPFHSQFARRFFICFLFHHGFLLDIIKCLSESL